MEYSNLKNSKAVVNDINAAAPNNASIGKQPMDDELVLKNRLTALVVDSSDIHRMVHRRVLASLGVESWEVKDGKDVLELVESGMVFDLILMDIDMPILNGILTTKLLRGIGVNTAIMGVASQALVAREREKREKFIESGLNHYCDKPLTREKLIPLLRTIDNDRSSGSSLSFIP